MSKVVKKGFTLIELSLSLTFIAILSLTVAFIINNTVASYRRGITLKQINTVGIGLVDDIRAAIQGSSTKSVIDDCGVVYGAKAGELTTARLCENDKAKNFVTLTKRANISGKRNLNNVPVYGAFCTGTYTYIWNSGYFFNEDSGAFKVESVSPAEVKFKVSGSAVENDICKKEGGGTMRCSKFKLLKVKDNSRSVCVSVAGNNYSVSNVGNVFDTTAANEVVDETPIDLLASDEKNRGLAIYNFFVSGPAESTAKNALFYAVSFVLGTIQGNADITKSGSFCATPDDYATEDFDYCSINKFNFAAEATGV